MQVWRSVGLVWFLLPFLSFENTEVLLERDLWPRNWIRSLFWLWLHSSWAIRFVRRLSNQVRSSEDVSWTWRWIWMPSCGLECFNQFRLSWIAQTCQWLPKHWCHLWQPLGCLWRCSETVIDAKCSCQVVEWSSGLWSHLTPFVSASLYSCMFLSTIQSGGD